MEKNEKYDLPLRSYVEDGVLRIETGLSTLKWAFENGENNNVYVDDVRDWVRQAEVSDMTEFAKDVDIAMHDEGEDGSTPLSRFLDQMMENAVEHGCVGLRLLVD